MKQYRLNERQERIVIAACAFLFGLGLGIVYMTLVTMLLIERIYPR